MTLTKREKEIIGQMKTHCCLMNPECTMKDECSAIMIKLGADEVQVEIVVSASTFERAKKKWLEGWVEDLLQDKPQQEGENNGSQS